MNSPEEDLGEAYSSMSRSRGQEIEVRGHTLEKLEAFEHI